MLREALNKNFDFHKCQNCFIEKNIAQMSQNSLKSYICSSHLKFNLIQSIWNWKPLIWNLTLYSCSSHLKFNSVNLTAPSNLNCYSSKLPISRGLLQALWKLCEPSLTAPIGEHAGGPHGAAGLPRQHLLHRGDAPRLYCAVLYCTVLYRWCSSPSPSGSGATPTSASSSPL